MSNDGKTSTKTESSRIGNQSSLSNNKQCSSAEDEKCIQSLNDHSIETVYSDIINDVLFGLIIQVHRAAKLGYLYYSDTDSNLEKQFEITNDYDIFGGATKIPNKLTSSLSSNNLNVNTLSSSSTRNSLIKYECVCPNCERSLAAIRFAPHLEKCMGLGRSSSRIASRRIAAFNGDDLDSFLDDDTHSVSLSSSSNSLVDVDAITSNNYNNYYNSNSYNNNLKPPSAKRKRLHASTSLQNLNNSPNANGANDSGSNPRLNIC